MTGTSALQVHSSNADQLRAWDGDEGAYWAEHAEYFDRSVAAYHERLLAAANITASDRVLDIGCGTGQTTRDAARAAAEVRQSVSTCRRGCSRSPAAGRRRRA